MVRMMTNPTTLVRTRPLRRGQAFLEYAMALSIAALVALAAMSLVGARSANVSVISAGVSPGAHPDDFAALTPNPVVELTDDGTNVRIDMQAIVAGFNTSRLSDNFGVVDEFQSLVVEVHPY